MTKSLSRSSYIRAVDAAAIFDLQSDYVTRIAKRGEIKGEKRGRAWYVEIGSLEHFFLRQVYERAKRNMQLSHARHEERVQGAIKRKVVTGLTPKSIHRALMQAISNKHAHTFAQKVFDVQSHRAPLYAMSPAVDLLHKVGALVTAMAVTFVLASGVNHMLVRESRVGARNEGAASGPTLALLESNLGAVYQVFKCFDISDSECPVVTFLEAYVESGNAEIRVESLK